MPSSTDTPNIVLITTDQQRFDSCGAAAPPWMRTPHIDALEREGVTFARAYADCPVCVPGRASIMTGQSVFTHGMGTNAPTCEYFGVENTLPTLLRARGYQTVGIGKLHFHPQRIRHGFDETITLDQYYREMRHSGNPLQPRRHGLGENEFYATMATVPEPLTLTSWITEQAVEFLARRRDPTVPFFLWVSYSKPHPPLDPPEPYYSMYRGVDTGAPWVGEWATDENRPGPVQDTQMAQNIDKMDPHLVHEARAAYYGLVTHIDYNIGRVLAAIQDKGTFSDYDLRDNTLIGFTADHGERLGDHHMIAKGCFLEGSAHVPMVLRMPRTWDNRCQGVTIDSAVTLHDILPTLVTAAGGDVPPSIEGQDLVALARGELRSPRRYVVGGQGFNRRRPDRANWVGITDGRWKYVWYYDGGSELLFDLAEDPRELRNLAHVKSHDARRSELRAEIEAYLRDHGGTFLEDGALYSRPYTPGPEAVRRTRAFPGLMLDTHASDCLH
ncbi:MAG: sulfatase-like hydrolase/transferase [Chitinivibrionales bacterium]|nr:sulfatase-like hydrolase/transferase [Chitinivibrionales bacterium]